MVAGERVTAAAFVGGALLAGGNAIGIRFSNRELDPLWGAGLRFSLAAALFVGMLVALRVPLPRGRALAGAVLFGVLQFGATYALAYYALVELHAGFGQILLALVPLMTLLLAVAQGQERLRLAAIVGTLLALVGVVVMSRAPLRESLPVLSVLAALGSALCFAQAAILVRRLPPLHPVAMNAVGMVAGAALLLAGSLAAGESPELPDESATWGAVGYLVTLGSVGVFLLYLFVLQRWTASRAAYSFVLIPVVAVILSAWLDDEPVGVGLVFGGLFVLVGVYVGAIRQQSAAEAAPHLP
ncbi:MAG: DMT family transporter [Actinobacteria bacterium]|nr:DMT family transporter [Actinomycetota bacterium]